MDLLQKLPTVCREDRNTIRGSSSQDMRSDACRLTQRLIVILAQSELPHVASLSCDEQ